MHAAHDVAGIICPYRNETQIKRSTQLTDLLEARAMWQMRIFGRIVVDFLGQVGHGAIASVAAKPDGFAAG